MFKTLRETAKIGLVTIGYPDVPACRLACFRGAPRFDFARWRDARQAAEVCPTEAISFRESAGRRTVTVDYGLCTYCGQCAEADPSGAVQVTQDFELAARNREDLVVTAHYDVNADGTQGELKHVEKASEKIEARVRDKIHRVLGRALAIREVDAGSCNGCEIEINALNSPVYDLERLGIHFVASPRHADMLLVTGPVTRNMELALVKAYRAIPDPRLVVAVGACGISGGIFGKNYASLGGVDQVLPVDVYIPGCPPRPQALLQGILVAIGRMMKT